MFRPAGDERPAHPTLRCVCVYRRTPLPQWFGLERADGLVDAPALRRQFGRATRHCLEKRPVPADQRAISDHVRLKVPGPQANAGSDHTALICHGVPAFRLQASYTEYRQYTWHDGARGVAFSFPWILLSPIY
jgi:hypothetical protein